MKKILLTIFTIILILSVNVLAIDIDIGTAAIDRGSALYYSRTFVNQDNPANASGSITSVEIWAYTDITNCEVAIFYVVSGNNLSTRDTEFIGTVTAGSKQTFEVNLDVEVGDYIGIWVPAGSIEYDNTGGGGMWRNEEDQIPCTNVTFTSYADYAISLYGTGTTAVGWDHKWNTQTISKWNTKEFTKWNDLE